ncbi:uncharacterized protein C8R40DRAFT_536930 [Lentinula edodes]|uniref:uncharacterized protein n=1 Tax=Lentinula edodes TaxID=5353 RepID=UPI001E8E8481|nr:uncharacterized protein C8R40DRAFT_536930 [Lentinula edodes]KAH7871857.1 hypothetical protein C8R40DRAFT_536930 [Lentinula edodes]
MDDTSYLSQFQHGTTNAHQYPRVQSSSVASAHRYHPYNDELIFNSKRAHPVSNTSSEYNQAIARHAQEKITAALKPRNQAALAQTPGHFFQRQLRQPQSQVHASTHPYQPSSHLSHLLPVSERAHRPTQSFPCSQASSAITSGPDIGNTRNTGNGMTLAAPIPKTFAARSETVLNALVATENKPHVAQGSPSFPLAQQLQRKFIEEQPLHPLQSQVHRASVACTEYQLEGKENLGYSLSNLEDVHGCCSSSYIRDSSTRMTFDGTMNAHHIDSLEQRKSSTATSLKKPNINSGQIRPVSPATMVALTEPILMSWCLDNEAVQRLAKATGY